MGSFREIVDDGLKNTKNSNSFGPFQIMLEYFLYIFCQIRLRNARKFLQHSFHNCLIMSTLINTLLMKKYTIAPILDLRSASSRIFYQSANTFASLTALTFPTGVLMFLKWTPTLPPKALLSFAMVYW